jgi:hypothetical protein
MREAISLMREAISLMREAISLMSRTGGAREPRKDLEPSRSHSIRRREVRRTRTSSLGIVLGGGAAVLGERWEHSDNRGWCRGPKHRHECSESSEDDQRRRVAEGGGKPREERRHFRP